MTDIAVGPGTDEINALVEGLTIVDSIEQNAARFGDRPALHWKEGDAWRSLTWAEYRERVNFVAAGLQAMGVENGDFVAILAGNRPEHVIADLGAIHARATAVTIYSTLSPPQIAYVANDCGAKVAILEGPDFMKRVEEVREQLPNLQHIVLLDGAEQYEAADDVISWDDLIAMGEERLATDPETVARAVAEIEPDEIATLIYTSGTTGDPKGVIITHHNIVYTTESVRRTVDLPMHLRIVSYLPMAHIAERMASHYVGTYLCGEIFFCPDMSNVLEYIQRAEPQLFVGVPRVWEKFAIRLRDRFSDASGIQGALLKRAVALGEKKVTADQEGGMLGFLDGIQHNILDRVVLSKVRSQLGMGDLYIAITASAPIDPSLIVFFQSLGIPLFELYGLSEDSGPATTARPGANKIGSVGPPIAGVEVKIDQDGEVLIRGGVTSPGYFHMPEETAATFDSDGWLHTGDLGTLDEKGNLSIIGRKKEIIINSAGKNIAPAKMETMLSNHPLISKACVIGDGRNYMTLLIALDAEEAPGWAESHGVTYEGLSQFSREEALLAEIELAVDEANQQVARVEQIKKHHIVPDEWTPESGEVTPSLKLKRRVVEERYAEEIDALYS
ncbi:MAG: AMP-binding protein [Acidimicrobiia bacterium]|nr:AMP-binding protein [Acidimicrobiia bacterium]